VILVLRTMRDDGPFIRVLVDRDRVEEKNVKLYSVFLHGQRGIHKGAEK
jgi:hypothetical protein